MARKRKHRRSHRRHANMPRRHHRRSRRYHRNAPLGVGSALMAGVAGLAAFALVRKGGSLIARVLPAAVPQHDIVGEAIAAAAIVALAPMVLKGDLKLGAQAGGVIAGGVAVLNMTPFGPMLNLERIVMLPPSTPAAAAALQGALNGQLMDDSEMEAHY